MTSRSETMPGRSHTPLRKPSWIRTSLPCGEGYAEVRSLVDRHNLHTVCASALCPNLGECWAERTATFMILGDICTRNCRFCAVKNGIPSDPEPDEPKRVADVIDRLQLDYAVITSVTRDDLSDGGAHLFAETIKEVRNRRSDCRVEVLIPDFGVSMGALDCVLEAKPDVLNHNAETVPRLYPELRPQARWGRSLEVLRHAGTRGFITKSGLIIGAGETRNELSGAIKEIADADVDILTVGQYLAPTLQHHPIERYVPPEEFDEIRDEALSMGFRFVVSGPLVRSSYRAKEAFESCFTAPRE